MQYVCDAPGRKTWFRLETEAEAAAEAALMAHAVDKYFARAIALARESYRPSPGLERDIGLKAHIAKTAPLFLTLRADDGEGLATAMLPPDHALKSARAKAERLQIIIVGPGNDDPYPEHGDAIKALGRHYGVELPRERCFPYG